MFKVISNKIAHMLKIGKILNTDFHYIQNSILKILLHENGFKCGQLRLIFKALINNVILTPRLNDKYIFFTTAWTISGWSASYRSKVMAHPIDH